MRLKSFGRVDLNNYKKESSYHGNLPEINLQHIANTIGNIDCSYVVVNDQRKIVIHSGGAAVGISKIWKNHTTCSFLREHKERSNKFYSSDSNTDHPNKYMLSGSNVRDIFKDLSIALELVQKNQSTSCH